MGGPIHMARGLPCACSKAHAMNCKSVIASSAWCLCVVVRNYERAPVRKHIGGVRTCDRCEWLCGGRGGRCVRQGASPGANATTHAMPPLALFASSPLAISGSARGLRYMEVVSSLMVVSSGLLLHATIQAHQSVSSDTVHGGRGGFSRPQVQRPVSVRAGGSRANGLYARGLFDLDRPNMKRPRFTCGQEHQHEPRKEAPRGHQPAGGPSPKEDVWTMLGYP